MKLPFTVVNLATHPTVTSAWLIGSVLSSERPRDIDVVLIVKHKEDVDSMYRHIQALAAPNMRVQRIKRYRSDSQLGSIHIVLASPSELSEEWKHSIFAHGRRLSNNRLQHYAGSTTLHRRD